MIEKPYTYSWDCFFCLFCLFVCLLVWTFHDKLWWPSTLIVALGFTFQHTSLNIAFHSIKREFTEGCTFQIVWTICCQSRKTIKQLDHRGVPHFDRCRRCWFLMMRSTLKLCLTFSMSLYISFIFQFRFLRFYFVLIR